MPRPVVAIAAVALVVAASCGGDAGEQGAGAASAPTTVASPDRSSGCGTELAAVGPRDVHERVDVTSGGVERWYARFVPSAYDGAPSALVVDLHGYLSGSAGQAALSDLGSLAGEAGFVLATPQGNGELPYWNAVPRAELPDDVAFVGEVIDDVGGAVCIDPGRVYVVGFSNGAFLTSLVACRLADRVAAVAAVAGLLLPADCAPRRPVPVLAVHGTDDRFVSFAGGPNPALAELSWDDESRAAFDGLAFADVTDTTARWAELQGCDPEPARAEVAATVERIAYGGCDGGSAVELYVVDGGGHTWPGSAVSAASASIVGATTEEIDANQLIWSFFDAHPLGPAAAMGGER